MSYCLSCARKTFEFTKNLNQMLLILFASFELMVLCVIHKLLSHYVADACSFLNSFVLVHESGLHEQLSILFARFHCSVTQALFTQTFNFICAVSLFSYSSF